MKWEACIGKESAVVSRMSVMPIFISVCAQREYVFFIATQSHFVMRDLFHKRMSVTPSPSLVCGNMIVSHATKQCTPKNVHCVPHHMYLLVIF
jgi:hypothetical protein